MRDMIMAGGRPRTTTPPPEEVIKLGEDLVQWINEPCPDGQFRNRWCEWYAIKHNMIKEEWKLLLQKPEFRPYYEKAQAYLGSKWINGDINHSIAHRFLRIYCPEVKDEEDEKTANDIRLKIEAETSAARTVTQDVIDKYNAMMAQITAIQDSARKIDSNKVPNA